jgi:hypothetical protein
MVAKHPVDTEACDCIAEPVEEDRFFGRAVVHEGEQRVDGCWPERAPAYLAALASELYVAEVVGNEVEVADPQRRCFGHASAGVVKEQQERMIAPALPGATVGSGEDGIHLGLVHIGEFVSSKPLERNGPYLAAPCDMFRAAFGDEARHRMNGGEPLVACANRTSSVLFEMIEEAAQKLVRQIEDIETIHRLVLLGGGIGHQQRECVAITALRVPAQVAFLDQMIEKEALDPWT